MSPSRFRTFVGITLAPVVAIIPVGCEPSEPKTPGRSAQAVMRVEVVHPERQTVRRTVGEPGQLVAYETTSIHAKLAGYVRTVTVNIGDQVKKGQVLAELYVPEVEADFQEKRAGVEQAVARRAQEEAAVKVAQSAVTSAEAKLAEVRAGGVRADADLNRWQLEYRRVEQLLQERAMTGTLADETRSKLKGAEAGRDEVVARVKSAEADLSESRSELEKARADVAAAAASIEVARAEARHAEALLGYARIMAPFDGTVTRRNVDTGYMTVPGASAATPLFVVARSDLITVALDVPETYATDVNPGDPASIKLQAMGGTTIEGKVTRTAWALESKTRTIRAEIDLPNPGGKLRPGLYAYATVVVDEHPDVLTVPATALVKENDATFCVIVVDGKAVRRPVKPGLSDATRTEIVSGLDGPEAVVKANAASLVEGQPVDAVRATEPATPNPEKASAKAKR